MKRRPVRLRRSIVVGRAMAVVLSLLGAAAAAQGGQGRWTIPDIVDVEQIQSVAISPAGGEAAYVLRQPSVTADRIGYGLYVVATKGGAEPKRLLQATYISAVTVSPRRGYWTVLANIGKGVELYDVNDRGVTVPVAVSNSIGVVGTEQGMIAPLGEPRRTGVISYQWSPDGKRLWYTTFRLRTPAERKACIENGVEYDDRRLDSETFRNYPCSLLGFDLHVKSLVGGSDRVVAFVPSVQNTDIVSVSRKFGTARWAADSRHVEYTRYGIDDAGRMVKVSWSVDALTGVRTALPKAVNWPLAVPAADGRGYYTVKRTHGGGGDLCEFAFDHRELKDLGPVRFVAVGSTDYLGGTWIDGRTGEQILSVYYPDHTGLVTLPQSPAGRSLERVDDNLRPCAFSKDLQVGVCARQSQILAPELVAVDGVTGTLTVIARPNADYARITPLRVEPARWTNRYGQSSDGYIVYPRKFSSARKYPVLVVTHGEDARNTFADQDLQAEIPVQALAEQGYVVALVNEPVASLKMRALEIRQRAVRGAKKITRMQMSVIVEPVATMEAAVASLVRSGIADPRRIGIAGYSRGAEVAMYAMTQSKVFKVASVDDGASGINADGYWSDGTRLARNAYRALYGGSAFSPDPKVLSAYRRFSPDFRASVFAGPLLEQPAEGDASSAFERLALLGDAGVPYDLVFYPGEAHIFWNPRATAASMERTLDWFNYWLLGERDPDPAKAGQYARWDSLRETYGRRCPSCLARLGPWGGSAKARKRGSVGAARR